MPASDKLVTLTKELTEDRLLGVAKGRIDPAYLGSGLPSVIFDGESVATSRGFPYLNTYTPRAGEVILLGKYAHGWIIFGGIQHTSNDNHSDAPHTDAHTDVSHTDSHSDVVHSDVAHSDVSHSDTHSD